MIRYVSPPVNDSIKAPGGMLIHHTKAEKLSSARRELDTCIFYFEEGKFDSGSCGAAWNDLMI